MSRRRPKQKTFIYKGCLIYRPKDTCLWLALRHNGRPIALECTIGAARRMVDKYRSLPLESIPA